MTELPPEDRPTKLIKPEPATLPEIQSIGRYQVSRELGSGGMGRVYLATDPVLERTVAVKLFNRRLEKEETRFWKEAKLTAKLDHPNTIELYGIGDDTCGDYLVMEYVAGESLAKALERGRLEVERTLAIVEAACRGIEHAHGYGIVHRNLKPANILLEEHTDRVVVVDFGLAKDIGTDKSLTGSGMEVEKCRYLAPEQIDPSLGKVNVTTDTYTLGTILYEALSGHYAVEGESMFELVHNICHCEPLPLRKHVPHLPKELERICRRATAKDQGERYQSAQALAKELARLRSGKGRTQRVARMKKETKAGWWAVASLLLLALSVGWWAIPAEREQGGKTNSVAVDRPNAWPRELWQLCWAEGPGLADFTTDAWGKLPASAQGEYAAAYQEWYGQRIKADLEKVVAVGTAEFTMRLVPPGRFWMGSPETENNRRKDEVLHRVTITKAYYLSKYELTRGEWEAVSVFLQKNWKNREGSMPSCFEGADLRAPVDCVSWESCREFCDSAGFRLPTEAEWEYACRAGTTYMSYAGDFAIPGYCNAPQLDPLAWYGGNSGVEYHGRDSSAWLEKQYDHVWAGPHPVGKKKANGWGFCDMLGNVWEWCQDSCEWDAKVEMVVTDTYSGIAWEDPLCRNGPKRVLRGGSWRNYARVFRSAMRLGESPEACIDVIGCRPAMSLSEKMK